MIQSLQIKGITGGAIKPAWLYLAYGIIGWLALQQYVSWQSVNVILGIIAMPLVITIQRENKRNVRYAWVALVFAIACIWLPVKTLLFFAIVFACFFITETCRGKMNLLPVLVAGLMSPLFQYVANVISFPVRLWLTGAAGSLMNATGFRTAVAGNIILYNGNEFSVDPACMGLNMMVVCLLLQIMLIAIFQKQYGVQVKTWLVFVLLAVALIMNIVSNLFRIISLVWLNILPDKVMHDVTGIFCLFLYVVLPMVFITRYTVKNRGHVNESSITSVFVFKKLLSIHILLFAIICLSALAIVKHNKATHDMTAPLPVVNGYTTQRIDAGIVKLENKRSLVYVKHIPGFYNADHHPMICWKGSGYIFHQVEKQQVGTQMVYTALLQSGKDQLYTAWWYDNGSARTIDQLSWRWDVLTGAKTYSVVNVTTADKQQLIQDINNILANNCLKPLL